MNKKIGMRFGIVLASVALIASGTVAAHGAAVPKGKAAAGLQCAAAGLVSAGRGVEGSDLTCITATLGTAKDSKVWGYKDLKPLTSIEFVSSSAIGGGY